MQLHGPGQVIAATLAYRRSFHRFTIRAARNAGQP